jgi:hypothetical protein
MKYLVIRKVNFSNSCASYFNDYHDGFDTIELANEYAQLQVKLEKSNDTTYTVVPFGNEQ